ncbi:unnamed protein product [Nesidiocoris tenuis]|uniref:Uncharacterized protein n=1 Tax=Nesidiocoris tenuis TaxID=355587 RepID=A0A6H5H5R6_9HEMI|nr:unnamed protein product [Nesidiocoris tenuis]
MLIFVTNLFKRRQFKKARTAIAIAITPKPRKRATPSPENMNPIVKLRRVKRKGVFKAVVEEELDSGAVLGIARKLLIRGRASSWGMTNGGGADRNKQRIKDEGLTSIATMPDHSLLGLDIVDIGPCLTRNSSNAMRNYDHLKTGKIGHNPNNFNTLEILLDGSVHDTESRKIQRGGRGEAGGGAEKRSLWLAERTTRIEQGNGRDTSRNNKRMENRKESKWKYWNRPKIENRNGASEKIFLIHIYSESLLEQVSVCPLVHVSSNSVCYEKTAENEQLKPTGDGHCSFSKPMQLQQAPAASRTNAASASPCSFSSHCSFSMPLQLLEPPQLQQAPAASRTKAASASPCSFTNGSLSKPCLSGKVDASDIRN